MSQARPAKRDWLQKIEFIGNKLPDITMLFIYALVICWLLSWGLSYLSFDYINPVTKKPVEVINLFQPSEILNFFTVLTKNFINFPPLGITIVATLGIGIAEASGFLNVGLSRALNLIPKRIITPAVIVISVLAHVASDSAYVVLMPVAALMFYTVGKHPLAGIAASFAGLAGGFSASFTPSIVDPIIQGFTQNAAQIIDPTYEVNVLGNYFFSFGSTFFVILTCWYITDKIIEPRLQKTIPIDKDLDPKDIEITPPTALDLKAFRWASIIFVLLALGLVLLAYPDDSLLRAPDGSLTSPQSPIMQMIVPLLLLFFAVPSLVHGIIAKSFRDTKAVTKSMEKITYTLVPFIVFSFFCAQFLYSFNRSGIGTLIALSGAEFLKSLQMPSGITIFGVLVLSLLLNIIITSATSKWAILSAILVPMLMSVNISPELTQAAFRISDSVMNVSTPMFAFYPLLISYCQRYYKATGVGTLCSMMIPYTIGLFIVLTILLYLYWGLDIPLGFDAGYVYPRAN
ncbi:AbgT family transporter [Mannheimia sp. AT1]|uniref:AbgT family transporter n=1 Tax=Mannheimia cairinae TaxID=3025936 RepID=A0ABT5MPK2_9PAST|nr:AbgT family transporter [Mannheimia cairinae]MDD0823907.1 AbgT family transporter [Mannheimia cairinae]MDD0825223.1 AbgT family transporter [Mannheimia cairinae]